MDTQVLISGAGPTGLTLAIELARRDVAVRIVDRDPHPCTGSRGDGHFYFKNGVYFCKTSQNGCFSHYKNVHLYTK